MKRSLVAGLALAMLSATALSGCGSNSLGGGQTTAPGASSSPAKSQSVDAALAAKLPAKIAQSKTITVGTDPTYAPNEFTDTDGTTVIGMDVDLFNAVMAKFGVKPQFQKSPFDSLIAGVQAGKYDVGVSSLTINQKREGMGAMISYFSAGNRWAIKKGNPSKFDKDNPCGKTVAVQTGTYQEQDLLPGMQKDKCSSNPMKILPFDGQDQATAAVASGKADATIADSPVIDYAVKQSSGQLETSGDMFESAPYGYLLPKDQTDFASAIAEALKQLKADGTYDQILNKWGVQAGKIDTFEVNPKVDG